MIHKLHPVADNEGVIGSNRMSQGQDNIQSRVQEVLTIKNPILDIQEETLQFLCGSRAINGPQELIQILLDVGEILNIQRFILYRIVNVTEAEILLIFSSCSNEPEYVGQIVPIPGNPNLEQATSTQTLSQVPVPGIGIDVAFPIGRNNLIVGLDNTDGAREFSREDMITMKPTALLLATAYNAGHAIHTAGTDTLTGLLNRRSLDNMINEGKDLFGNSIPQIQSVLFFDFDKFKRINDGFDHAVGDAAIYHVAYTLKQSIEKLGGTIARYGGDEFAATLPRTATIDEIDTIRCNLSETPFEFIFNNKTEKLILTTSVGFCNIHDIPNDIIIKEGISLQQSAIKLADAAVKEAKEKRNVTVQYLPKNFPSPTQIT
ncbi:MAG: GGDEF domain-containing protein [Candidatus Gracilibacteria bacterium]|nr:GGDEF domain-containing protein [Candidatus Gracilibacteria bacterium]